MKPIRLSAHAQGYTEKRGFTVTEVAKAIQTAPWARVERGTNRFECSMEFVFDQEWNRKHYANKRVRPIFVEEEIEILVITVYTYYY